MCASFLFVGDLNDHHQEWLGSATTNRHGVAAFDFATVSGCDQLVVGPTHARGLTLDLLMADVPELVRVSVVAPWVTRITPLCRQSFRWLRLFRTCLLVRKFSLNIMLIGIRFVVQCRIYPGVTFGLLTILLRFRMSVCCCWLDVLFQPRSSVCATRISLDLMINAGMLLASSWRLIFGGSVISLGLTG